MCVVILDRYTRKRAQNVRVDEYVQQNLKATAAACDSTKNQFYHEMFVNKNWHFSYDHRFMNTVIGVTTRRKSLNEPCTDHTIRRTLVDDERCEVETRRNNVT